MADFGRQPPPPSYEQSGAGGGSGGDCKKGPLPPNLPTPGAPASSSEGGRQRFSSRVNQIYLSWLPVAKGGRIPARAIEGRDSVGLFVARARQGYSMLPGKAARQLSGCHAAHAGQEVIFAEYEVLCDSSIDAFGFASYDWVACDGSGVGLPPQALAGGYSESGEPLFVARGSVNGERVFGYFAVSQRCASFPWGGKEHRSCDFELLVTR